MAKNGNSTIGKLSHKRTFRKTIITTIHDLGDKVLNEITGHSLIKMGQTGGPRCCKRNTFTAISEACKFIEDKLDVRLYDYENEKVKCAFKQNNKQCIGKKCPFI